MMAGYDCRQIRRKLVTHHTLNYGTCPTTPWREEWVTEPCGQPLFDAPSQALGKCPGCEGGWTSPNNYPVSGKPA